MVLSCIFIVLAARFILRNWDSFQTVTVYSPVSIVLVGFFFIGNILCLGLLNWYILRVFSIKLNYWECYFISAVTTMTNFLMPLRGGSGFRAVYLKKRHDLPYTRYISIMAAIYTFQLFVFTLFGLLSLAWFAWRFNRFNIEITLSLMTILGITGWAIFFAPSFPRKEGKFWGRISNAAAGWDMIRRNRFVLFPAILTITGFGISTIAGIYAGFKVYDISISLSGCILQMVSQNIGGLIGFTPGAIGFQELLGMYFSVVMDNTMTEVFLVLLTIRLIRILTAVITGIPGLILLSKKNVFKAEADKCDIQ